MESNAKFETLKAGIGTGLMGEFILSDVINLPSIQKDESRTKVLTSSNVDFFMLYCKPYLFDMADLTEQELEYAGFDCHIDYLTNEFKELVKGRGFKKVINDAPFGHIQWLVKNHFNVFDLPETAYIKVTEQNNPYK